MKAYHTMKINFNNVRRQACFAYDGLVKELNNSKEHEGYLLVNPERIEKRLNDLRMMIGSIAMTYEDGNPDFEDVYAKEYPEGKELATFEFESEED